MSAMATSRIAPRMSPTTTGGIATLTEAQALRASPTQRGDDRAAAWLHAHYRGGLVLMESFGNENIAFQIPSDQLIYEGSYRQWPPSLRNPPANNIEWIVARCGNSPYPDKVCLDLGQAQLSHYSLIYTTADHDYRVYRLGK